MSPSGAGCERGTAIVGESIGPNRHWRERIGINLLLGADPAPPNGGAAIHDTAVWLEPVTADLPAARAGLPAE